MAICVFVYMFPTSSIPFVYLGELGAAAVVVVSGVDTTDG